MTVRLPVIFLITAVEVKRLENENRRKTIFVFLLLVGYVCVLSCLWIRT